MTLTDPSTQGTTTRDGVASRIEAALRPLLAGPLPVRLRAWDGSEAGPAEGMLVELCSPQALTRLLWHPGELGAAQAYVTGELEVHGDIGDALDLVRETVAARSVPPLTPARV
ncbi:MAG: SAM-dependent methyltransferase, partial [Micrococcales bacterium]|nr:SAM-dependent methyltransferase [Micrococcales bacterium]